MKTTSIWVEANKFFKQAYKKKKKKYQKRWNNKKQTLANIANAIKAHKMKKKNYHGNVGKITCYNCNKKNYYAKLVLSQK